jgi:hypothetical protein
MLKKMNKLTTTSEIVKLGIQTKVNLNKNRYPLIERVFKRITIVFTLLFLLYFSVHLIIYFVR